MAFTFGFYNSVKGDRKYDAVQMSQMFDGLILDGVFMTVGDAFMVTASTDMTVNVGIGRAWFNHTWNYNDAILPLTLEPSEVILDRIDAIVLEVNRSEEIRANTIKIIKGTPSTNPLKPTMVKGELLSQYPICYIKVNRGVTLISQEEIENTVGTSECPFVTGVLEGMDIDALVARWEDQWDNWMVSMMEDAKEFQESNQADFNYWFNEVKDVLSDDAAGNLMIEIQKKQTKEYGKGLTTTDYIAPYTIESVLEASKWSDKKYSFEELYPEEQYDLLLAYRETCTIDEIDAWGRALLAKSISANILTAIGETPIIDIPIYITVKKKGVSYND